MSKFKKESLVVNTRTVSCSGEDEIVGHPLVYLEIGPENEVECPYCSKKFIYKV